MKSVAMNHDGAKNAGRARLVAHALRLEALTGGWALLEAGVAIVSGWMARSLALTSFGLDSLIEAAAAAALLYRLLAETRGDDGAAERAERRALRVIGVTFFLLAAYVLLEGSYTLWTGRSAEASPVGVAVAAAALVVMPVLGFAKLRIGRKLGSSALVADAKESFACGWLSATVLIGLVANLAFGWWWADPVAALCMLPFLLREGREALEHAGGGEEDEAE